MARQILNEIGLNDDIQDVIRKTNDNFKRVAQQTRAQVERTVSSNTDRVDQAVQSALGEIKVAIENARTEIEAAEKQAEDKLDLKIKEIDDKMKELDELLDGISSSEAKTIITNVASIIYGAEVSGLRILLPQTNDKVAVGNINITVADDETAYLKTHEGTDSNDIEIKTKGEV